MKIGIFEGVALTFFAVVCDIINIVLTIMLIGIAINTIVNIFFGLFFVLWFMIRMHFVDERDDFSQDENDQMIEAEKDRLKKMRDLGQEEESKKPRVGAEIAERETGDMAEKEAVQVAEKTATQTAEKVAVGVGERAVASTTEKVVAQTGERLSVKILGRVLGTTIAAKVIPGINIVVGLLPLWTISIVLLWRRSIKDQHAKANA